MTDEEWKPVVGYEGMYEVSNMGRVRCVDRILEPGELFSFRPHEPVIMQPRRAKKNGYPFVHLKSRQYVNGSKLHFVHRLVAAAFLGPRPPGLVVCHWDDNPENNVLSNLRYDTRAANVADGIRNGRHYGKKVEADARD